MTMQACDNDNDSNPKERGYSNRKKVFNFLHNLQLSNIPDQFELMVVLAMRVML